jgi:hypothetical protein
MKRSDVRKIAETITNEQLQQMFNEAKIKIKDWTKISNVNKGMTKGVAWNILAKDFNINLRYHILAKTNMIREFGEFLPNELKISHKKTYSINPLPVHQEPIL